MNHESYAVRLSDEQEIWLRNARHTDPIHTVTDPCLRHWANDNPAVFGREALIRRFASDWILNLLRSVTEDVRELFVADCADHVLSIYEAAYPNDTRVRDAIQARRAFAHGRIFQERWPQAIQDAAHAAESATAEAAREVATCAAFVAKSPDGYWQAAQHAAHAAAYAAKENGMAWHDAMHDAVKWQWQKLIERITDATGEKARQQNEEWDVKCRADAVDPRVARERWLSLVAFYPMQALVNPSLALWALEDPATFSEAALMRQFGLSWIHKMLLTSLVPTEKAVVACHYANLMVPLYEAVYPDDHRVRAAVQAGREEVGGDPSDAQREAHRLAQESVISAGMDRQRMAWMAATAAAWAAIQDAAQVFDWYRQAQEASGKAMDYAREFRTIVGLLDPQEDEI